MSIFTKKMNTQMMDRSCQHVEAYRIFSTNHTMQHIKSKSQDHNGDQPIKITQTNGMRFILLMGISNYEQYVELLTMVMGKYTGEINETNHKTLLRQNTEKNTTFP